MAQNVFLENYKYYAFVSYSRKDQKIAKWLQNKLERYRLPAKIRKEHSEIPKKLFPIFRDQTDLTGIELAEALMTELVNSKYLIVICSPNSARSEWVNWEIECFKALGKEKFIIPFIVDGEPFTENECFPEAIKTISHELLGINYKASGKRHAFLQLVSTMLSLRLDTLIERDKKRRRKYRAAVSLASLACLLVSGYALYYNVPHSKYYADVVYKYEIPHGIYELTREERQTRAVSYKLTSKGGKVISIEKVNILGTPTQNLISIHTSYPVQEYAYDSSGNLVSVYCYDEFRNIKLIENISSVNSKNEIAIDFVIPSDTTVASALSADLIENSYSDSDEKSEITRILNTYNSEGFLVKTLYQKTNLNIPTCDMNGIYGLQYEYSELGQIVTISNLDQDGEVFDCRYGWAKAEYTYNKSGLVTGEQFKDKNDNNVWNKNVSFTELTYDENNNLIAMTFYDEDGKLCNTSYGCAIATYKYNAIYQLVSCSYYNSENEAAYDENGVHSYLYTLNSKGQVVDLSFYDASGNYTYSQAYQCFIQKNAFDSKGRLIQTELFDAERKPMYSPESGAFATRYKYDELGFLCEVNFLDENHEPVMTKYGYASWIEYRDELGRTVRYETRDAQGNLVCSHEGFAAAEYTYDTFGNIKTISYFNEKNEPGYHSDGNSVVACEYENGNLVRVSYYDHNGDPVKLYSGYHARVMEYENGNCVCTYYLDTDNDLIANNKNLSCIYMYEYDSKGNVSKISTAQDSTKRAVRIIECETNKLGNIERKDTYELFNQSITKHLTTKYAYDIYGNTVAEYYFENGELLYKCLYEYDSKGNILKIYELGADDLPYNFDDPSYCNLYEYVYDEFGFKQTENKELHVGIDSTEVLNWQKGEFDSRGNLVFTKYFDKNGELFLYNGIYAAVRYEYNHRGDVVLCEYLDMNMQLTPYSNYSVIKLEYNSMGKETKREVLDYNGVPVSSRTGVPATMTFEYDYQGRLICTTYYDENNNLFAYDNGAAKIEYIYDSLGYYTVVSYDENGNVISEEIDIIIASDVLQDSISEQMGVCASDIILVWGDWNYFNELESGSDFISSFSDELSAKENEEKRLVVARLGPDGEYSILEFMMPAGKIGIAVSSDYATTAAIDRIREAYNGN